MVSAISLSVSLSAANLCSHWYIHPSFMCLIIKGRWKCSGAQAFAWVSSGKSFAFDLDVYGFMHGTTYCLIGHHSNDIVAVGRHLQRSSCLRVNGWIGVWVCFYIGVKTIKKRFFQTEAEVQWCRCKKQKLGNKVVTVIIWHLLYFYRLRHAKYYTHTIIRLCVGGWAKPPDQLPPRDQISDH